MHPKSLVGHLHSPGPLAGLKGPNSKEVGEDRKEVKGGRAREGDLLDRCKIASYAHVQIDLVLVLELWNLNTVQVKALCSSVVKINWFFFKFYANIIFNVDARTL